MPNATEVAGKMKRPVSLLVVLSLLTWAFAVRLSGGSTGLVSIAAAQEAPPNIEGVFGAPPGQGAGLGGLATPAEKGQRELDTYTNDELIALGGEIYNTPALCTTCHGANGEGLIGPTFENPPSPYLIAYQMQSNPQMAVVVELLDPSVVDAFALTYYITQLREQDPEAIDRGVLLDELASLRVVGQGQVVLSRRDRLVEQIAPFATVIADWTRKAGEGSLEKEYDVTVVAEYDAGEPKFTPEPGRIYFYENLDQPNFFYYQGVDTESAEVARASQVAVGDAATREIIVANEMPEALSGQVHTTVLSPDARFVYITGPAAAGAPEGNMEIVSPASLLKVDALTLEPIKQLIVGGRLHHGQVFRDKYLLMDTFARDPDGLDVFLLDPQTDEILGGIQCEDLGGSCYTAFTDDEYIYLLMQPAGYGPPAFSGIIGGEQFVQGNVTVLRPYWVARIDPDNWEVVREYPHPGYRANWIVIDSAGEYMYIPSGGTSNISKINLDTGEIAWVSGTGTGPYGASLNPDETEIWVADKGEVTGFRGRTVTVIDTENPRAKETLFGAYTVDHLLLAPNGREMWATSNGEGTIHVFDVATREKLDIIEMPGLGNPHGLVWVHYDEDGTGRVVRDQGGFHGGIDPNLGVILDY